MSLLIGSIVYDPTVFFFYQMHPTALAVFDDVAHSSLRQLVAPIKILDGNLSRASVHGCLCLSCTCAEPTD